jgi:signal peptide peptidase SppA
MISDRIISRFYGEPQNLTSEAWYAFHGRVMAQEPFQLPKQPLAKRPTEDRYGDPIDQMEIVNGVARIPIKGSMLMKGATPSDKWFLGWTAYEDIDEDLDQAVAAGVRRIVLDIDSPGGSVLGNYETAAKIAEIARGPGRRIPVEAYVSGICCSAAYFLASAANTIIAPPSAIVGSIGTMWETRNVAQALKQLGIEVNVFTSGIYKGMGHPAKPLTEEQEAFAKERVRMMAQEFKSFVTQFRPIRAEAMEGQTFTGRQALQEQLIDATTTGSIRDWLS